MVAVMPQWAAVALIDAGSGRQMARTSAPPDALPPATAVPEAVERVATTRAPAVRTRAPELGGFYAEHAILLFVPVMRDDAVRARAGRRGEVRRGPETSWRREL